MRLHRRIRRWPREIGVGVLCLDPGFDYIERCRECAGQTSCHSASQCLEGEADIATATIPSSFSLEELVKEESKSRKGKVPAYCRLIAVKKRRAALESIYRSSGIKCAVIIVSRFEMRIPVSPL